MTDTIARLKSGKLNFETMVDLESAMKLKKGSTVDINDIIRDQGVWTDLKKGMRPSQDELMNVFGTTDFHEIVEKIVKKGNLEVTQEFRDEEIELKRKQIVDFLVRNAVDARTNRPFTPDMINSALKNSGAKIDKQNITKQLPYVIETLKKTIPIKIETKKIKIKIPSEHTGKTYGLVQEYKEKEEWLPDGSLSVIINIPIGLQSDFYDKLNSITHGSALTSEVKE